MASSSTADDTKSFGYVQRLDEVQCNICGNTKEVTSHCTDCVKNICVKCKQSHNNRYRNHKLVTVFEGQIFEHAHTTCETHFLVFSHYCQNCKINICNKCQKTTHSKCNLVVINKHTKMLKNHFTKLVDGQRNRLPEIDKALDSLEDHSTNFDKIIEKEIDSVIKSAKYVNAKKLELIKQLKSKQSSGHKTLQDYIQIIQDLRTSIDDITISFKLQIDLVPDEGILQLVNEGMSKLDSTSIKTTFELPNPFLFEPSTLRSQGNIQSGSLQIAVNTTLIIDTRVEHAGTCVELHESKSSSQAGHVLQPTSPNQFPSLRQELSAVRVLSLGGDLVSCTSDGSNRWLGLKTGLYSDEVQLFNQYGDKLLAVQLLHGVHYMALTTEAELLVSGWDTKVISRVNKLGKTLEFTDLSAPGVKCVRGLATTRNDDVFVCVRMTGKDKIFTLSARGKKISELNSDFFIDETLYGIHAVSRDTFCVLDGEGRTGGRLVFIDGKGQLVRHIDRTTPVLQRDITALVGDKYGHLIVGTFIWGGMSCIHILSGEGACKRTFPIEKPGEIQGVSVSEDDTLWIGTRTGTRKLILAKYIE